MWNEIKMTCVKLNFFQCCKLGAEWCSLKEIGTLISWICSNRAPHRLFMSVTARWTDMCYMAMCRHNKSKTISKLFYWGPVSDCCFVLFFTSVSRNMPLLVDFHWTILSSHSSVLLQHFPSIIPILPSEGALLHFVQHIRTEQTTGTGFETYCKLWEIHVLERMQVTTEWSAWYLKQITNNNNNKLLLN